MTTYFKVQVHDGFGGLPREESFWTVGPFATREQAEAYALALREERLDSPSPGHHYYREAHVDGPHVAGPGWAILRAWMIHPPDQR